MRNLNNLTDYKNTETRLKAFTLVELVVVILIISILGTIAFISFQGYSRDARDSKRVSDIGNIKKSLELYFVDSGEYPSPDSFSTITYSGGTENVRYQGNVGDKVVTNLKGLNKKPLDPLFKTPYIYSVTNSYEEYQVLGLYEGNVAYNNVINMVNAATTSLTPKLDGNYNGVFVKTDHYIIPTPSIITSEPLSGGTLLLNSSNIRSQVTNNGINIPQNVLANSSTGGLDINFSVYAGSISSKSSTGEMVNAVKSIQNAFTGTAIGKTQDKIKYVLSQSTTSQLISLGNTTILKGRIPLAFNGSGSNILPPSSNSCATNPGYVNASYVTGNPTIVGEPWQNTNSANACYYQCTGGYTGTTCNTPPSSQKTVTDCGTTAGQIIYGTADGTATGLTCSDDIMVCNGTTGSGHVISACNAGSSIVYTGGTNQVFNSSSETRTITINAWAGGMYQWGNNADLSLTGSTTSLIPASSVTTGSTYNNPNSFIESGSKNSGDWVTPKVDDLWGSITNTLTSKIGPCNIGYHIPSTSEFNSVISGYGSNGNLMLSELKLPITGNRHASSSSFYQEGVKGYYWTVSINTNDNTKSDYLRFTTSSINISSSPYYSHANAMSVRCFKN